MVRGGADELLLSGRELLCGYQRLADRVADLSLDGGGEPRYARDGGVVAEREDAADHGNAERTACLACRVVDGGADAGLAGGQRSHDRFGRRRRGEAHAEPEEHAHETTEHDRGHDRVRRIHQQRGRHDQQATYDNPLGPEALDQLGRLRCAGHDADRHGRGHEAGLQRGIPEDELEVLSQQERRAEQREVRERDRRRRRREARVSKEAHVEHGVGRVRLPVKEQREEPDPRRHAGQDTWRGPTDVRSLDDPVEQPAERDDRQHRADGVEPSLVWIARGWDEVVAEHDGGDADGDVHEEHRAPCEVLEQQAAAEWADNDPQSRHTGPDADGARPLLTLEGVGEDRQGRREDERTPDAHQSPRHDEHARRRRPRRGRGEDREQHQAGRERTFASETIAKRPGSEQQAREDDGVGVNDPLQLRALRVQISNDRREGDVENRVVDTDDDQRDAQHAQGPPTTLVHRVGGR